MSTAGIKAGDAYIRLGLEDETDKDLRSIADHLSWIGSSTMRMSGAIMAAWSAIAGAIGFVTYQTGRYEAALTRVNMVYGDLADSQFTWMNDFRKLTLRSKTQVAEMIATFGAFTKGLGFTNDEAMILARGLAIVSSNMSTFASISVEESAQRFRSAMAGSSEVLDMLGINIKEAALNKKLLELGFKSISNGASESQKVLARYSIILESMRAQGSLFADATMMTMPRAIEILKGAVSDFLVGAGEPFVGVATDLLGLLTAVVKIVTRLTASFKWLIPAISPAFIAMGVFAGTMLFVGFASAMASKAIAGYQLVLEGMTVIASTASMGNAALAASILAVGTAAATVLAIIALIAAEIYMVGKALDDAEMKSIGFSMALSNLWFSLQQGDWGGAWESFYDAGIIAFKKLALGFGDLVAGMIDRMIAVWNRGIAEMNRSLNAMLHPFRDFMRNSFFGDMIPKELYDQADKIATETQAKLDRTAHEWATGGNSINFNDSKWARDRKALVGDIEKIENRISKRNSRNAEERKRIAEEEMAAQEENIRKMSEKYRNMAGNVTAAAMQAPQALSYRSVEGQRAAYQNQLGMLDRLTSILETNRQVEDNTQQTNFELQQLRQALQPVP